MRSAASRLESLLLVHVDASVLKQQCGPLLGAAGQNIRKLVKDGFVIKKPMKIHSRSRAREAQLAKSKGRHSGYGAQQTAVLLLLARWLAPVTEDH